ncbi:nudix hydrolase 20, chloroplastic-like [Solanum pennellii]|uniref:Nudix hydrolase 20, chloroplastic-like n=1 Tax=Solanum pennellii TaxID=28526 RepID=A0ABM1H5W2_SOLPN|nr:nudix hydrolase 20, chloroplastic-like [Solanum pennellii]
MSCNYLYRSVSHRLPNFICYTPIAPTILSLKSPFCPSRRRRHLRSFSISAGNSFTWDDVFRVPESPQNDDSALSGFFDKIKLCNRDLEKQCEFMPFVIEDQIIGYVHHRFADFLKPFQNVFIFPQDNTYGSHFECYCTLHPNLSTPNDRTKAVANVVKSLGELIPGIRNELFPVASAFGEQIFFSLERAAAPYFGIKAYGVHMNGYLEKDGQEYLWLGKRSEQKATYPGMLDHLVAGGLPHDISCGENLIKECEEEAGIPRSISHTARPVGAVSYIDIEGYRMKRDVLFCYDLKLPDSFIPHNEDGEVESFQLVPVTKVANIIRNTSFFKANCNLVITDFLFRHGHIRPEVFGYLKLLQSLRSGHCS